MFQCTRYVLKILYLSHFSANKNNEYKLQTVHSSSWFFIPDECTTWIRSSTLLVILNIFSYYTLKTFEVAEKTSATTWRLMQRILAYMAKSINYTSSALGSGGKDHSTIPTAIVVDKISTTIAGGKTALTVVCGGAGSW